MGRVQTDGHVARCIGAPLRFNRVQDRRLPDRHSPSPRTEVPHDHRRAGRVRLRHELHQSGDALGRYQRDRIRRVVVDNVWLWESRAYHRLHDGSDHRVWCGLQIAHTNRLALVWSRLYVEALRVNSSAYWNCNCWVVIYYRLFYSFLFVFHRYFFFFFEYRNGHRMHECQLCDIHRFVAEQLAGLVVDRHTSYNHRHHPAPQRHGVHRLHARVEPRAFPRKHRRDRYPVVLEPADVPLRRERRRPTASLRGRLLREWDFRFGDYFRNKDRHRLDFLEFDYF